MTFLRAIACFGVALHATSSFAIFDLQLSGGRRTADHLKFVSRTVDSREAVDTSTTELRVAAHTDPFDTVPIAFGMFYGSTLGGYDVTRESHAFEKFSGYEAGPEIMFWIPTPSLVPFAKIGKTVFSRYDAEVDQSQTTNEDLGLDAEPGQKSVFSYEADAWHAAIGLGWSPTPLCAIFVFGDYGMGNLKFKKSRYGSTDTTKDVEVGEEYELKPKFQTQAYAVGIELGI